MCTVENYKQSISRHRTRSVVRWTYVKYYSFVFTCIHQTSRSIVQFMFNTQECDYVCVLFAITTDKPLIIDVFKCFLHDPSWILNTFEFEITLYRWLSKRKRLWIWSNGSYDAYSAKFYIKTIRASASS